jgi:hypothetical protein
VVTTPGFEPVQELLQRQARTLLNAYEAALNRDKIPSGGNLELVRQRLDDVATITVSKLYAYRYDQVPVPWRQLYTDTLVLLSYVDVLDLKDSDDEEILSRVVESLDRAMITTGGISTVLGSKWIDDTMEKLRQFGDGLPAVERPRKRQKVEDATEFSSLEPFERPQIKPDRACDHHAGWTVERFEDYMNAAADPEPIVFTDLMSDWPALNERPWRSVPHLLSQTVGGRRLVPVEIGRSYVDEGWGQQLIPFRDFLDRYIHAAPSSESEDDGRRPTTTGYLAQHNLFHQIPSLRNDIRIPDLCWADVPGHPIDAALDHPPLDVPQLNAWFGPARTITPLHTDGYHNLLCQVVGTKYVRLYPPRATPHMRPRPPEHGVDMSNTSAVDLGVVEGWDAPPEDEDEDDLKRLREELGRLPYKECVLGPGDALLIPIGWWHYVRSLSVSFSVSFWWN